MRQSRRSLVFLLAALMLLLVAQPVLAQGSGHTVFGQEYTLPAGERLDGDLVVLGGVARLEAESVVEGNVTVMGGETVIEGVVRGDVVAVGGTLELGSGAVIDGDLVAFGNIRRHPSSSVRGDIVTGPDAARRFGGLAGMLDERATPQPRSAPDGRRAQEWSWLGSLARQVLALATALAVAALAVMVLPGHLERITAAMTTAWLQSLGVGALTGAAALVLAPVLAITCIGLPAAFVLITALALSVLLGWTGAGQLVGARLARAANLRISAPLGETLLGVGVISLIAMAPCLGLLAALPVAAWGLGAVVLTRFGTRTYVPAPLPPASGTRGAPTEIHPETRPLEAPPGDEGEQ